MRKIWQALLLIGNKPARAVDPPTRQWLASLGCGRVCSSRHWPIWACALWACMFIPLAAAAIAIAHYRLQEEWPRSVGDVLVDIYYDHHWTYIISLLIAVLLATGVWFLTRFFWQRTRIRLRLQRRHHCPRCKHDLRGQPVHDGSSITCPECGTSARAIAAWNEVHTSDSARPTFAPATDLMPPIVTRRRVMFITRAAAAIALLAAISYGTWWGIREVGFRAQAAEARAARPGQAALEQAVRRHMPPPPADSQPTVQELAKELADEISAHTERFRAANAPSSPIPGDFYPDASYVKSFYEVGNDATERFTAEASLRLVEELRQRGAFELLDRLNSASTHGEVLIKVVGEQSQSEASLGHLRRASRLAIARIKLARERGNINDFRLALAAAQSLERAARVQSSFISLLVANAMHRSMRIEAAAVLLNKSDPFWLEALQSFVNDADIVDVSAALEVEEMLTLDTLAEYFSDHTRLRKGLEHPDYEETFSPLVLTLLGGDDSDSRLRLGTFAENTVALTDQWELLSHRLKQEPNQRATVADTDNPSDLAIPTSLQSLLNRIVTQADRELVFRRAFHVMFELEHHRLQHGSYPAAIADCQAAASIIDPFSGSPFGYRLIDPTTDKLGRGYLLWTTGLDRQDDGGVTNRHRVGGLRFVDTGHDVIVNDPSWW